ncbi:olfactory receptor 5AR1-like [Rhinatrema bivittatum]|uniref:olfactory receptor 5AR1-like n=1 Tax=Rhinatrema bivittatum TaxID=194408 RepID=UPI00112AF003|nr:olfactory receptor 5AR1-like [Rhinatrema bivittatum]
MRPTSLQSPDKDKLFSLLYMAVIPMLNPIIYSLRNTDVKGNLLILELIYLNPCLHTPMYFFVSNLSFLDICYTPVTLPEALVLLCTERQHLSLIKCLTQLYFFISFACTEFLLLTVMAYDRYMAVCNPLHYVLIMNKKICAVLAAAAWIIGFLDPVAHILIIEHLSFCGSLEIDHFFCEMRGILKFSCSDTHFVQILTYIYGALIGLSSFLLTLISYASIVTAILKIQSTEGRRKAFSTCTSHMTIIILFYVTIMFVNMSPTSASSQDYDKFISILYVVLIPLVNPIVYSLKNKDLKRALRKSIIRSKHGTVNASFVKKFSQ